MSYNLKSPDVCDIIRQPSKKENLTSSVIVEFIKTLIKSTIMAAVRDYNKHNPKNKFNLGSLGMSIIVPNYITE